MAGAQLYQPQPDASQSVHYQVVGTSRALGFQFGTQVCDGKDPRSILPVAANGKSLSLCKIAEAEVFYISALLACH